MKSVSYLKKAKKYFEKEWDGTGLSEKLQNCNYNYFPQKGTRQERSKKWLKFWLTAIKSGGKVYEVT